MSSRGLTGKVQTVLGPVDPGSLGVTLTHEHLLVDQRCYFDPPEEASARAWVHAPLTMDRLGGATERMAYFVDAITLLDVQAATEEVLRYKHAGGGSLVDATSAYGLGRDPLALARISRATGLNIIMGSSYYVPLSHPADMDQRSEESIAEEIVRDVTVGAGDTGVRSGIIGEVGNWWPATENQWKVMRASAHAQQRTGAPILIHPGYHPRFLEEGMEVLVKAGADPQRVVMGHLDSFHDLGLLKSLAETGCYMEWDIFGREDTSREMRPASMRISPSSDVQRLEKLEFLIERGYEDRLVVAHDVCFKFQHVRYGGKGYSHILDNIVPRMRARGFTDDHIKAILVDNPRRILTFE